MSDLTAVAVARSGILATRLNVRRRRVGLVDLEAHDVIKYVMAALLDLTKAEAMYNLFMSECGFLKKRVNKDYVDALQDGIFMLPAGIEHVFDKSAIAILTLRNFLYGETNLEKLKQSIIFQVMNVADTENVRAKGVTLLIDCNGAVYSKNWSAWLGRWLLNTLEHMLPVALKHVYFVRAPLWMNMSVLSIRMFMSAGIATRVEILNDLDLVLENKYQALGFRPDDSIYALLRDPVAKIYPEFIRRDEVPEEKSEPATATKSSTTTILKNANAPAGSSVSTDVIKGVDAALGDSPVAIPPLVKPLVADPPQMRADSLADKSDDDADTVFSSDSGSIGMELKEESTLGYANFNLDRDFCKTILTELDSKSSSDIKSEYDDVHQANASSYESQRVENEHKNRYTNIMAYDHSRVKLQNYQQLTDPEPTDYINANFVAGYDRPRKYIASQGPLRHTAHAFWLMIFEQKSNTVVMVTREKEKRRVKCERYWPEEGETNNYGDGALTVTNEGADFADEYIVRRFTIKSGDETLAVNHFQYTGWPDFGVPEGEDGTGAMLHFWIELVLQSQMKCETPDAPIVTHCSAGIGRTGTLILLDRALEELHKGRAINLTESLQTMRNYRYGLVMTEQQYQFVYLMLEDYLDQIYDKHSDDTSSDNDNDM